MRIFLVLSTLLLLSLTSCSKSAEKLVENPISTKSTLIQVVDKQQIQDIPFENGQGLVMVVFDQDSASADCIVVARGLKPEEEYKISLIGDNGGVLFGPKENVQIRVGTLEGEVTFRPNSEGELFVSMRNPTRILTEAKELIFKIETKDNKEFTRTISFVVNKRL